LPLLFLAGYAVTVDGETKVDKGNRMLQPFRTAKGTLMLQAHPDRLANIKPEDIMKSLKAVLGALGDQLIQERLYAQTIHVAA